MYFSLVNLEGKTLDSFRDELVARAALRATVEANPPLADEVLLLRNEDGGEVAGPSLMYADLAETKVTPEFPEHVVITMFPAPLSGIATETATHGYVIRERVRGHERLQGGPLERTASQPA
jgi:hypothetical protein